jgi:hypothetical protein
MWDGEVPFVFPAMRKLGPASRNGCTRRAEIPIFRQDRKAPREDSGLRTFAQDKWVVNGVSLNRPLRIEPVIKRYADQLAPIPTFAVLFGVIVYEN